MKLLFIVNPAAGGGRGLRVWRQVEAILAARRIEAEHCLTGGPGETGASAIDHARRARDAFDAIVGVGGDGTLQEIANGLVGDGARCRAALGVIPGGTGNDFCKMLGYPKDPEGALDVVLGGTVRPFDAGIVNGSRVFINVMGVGFDAEVAGFLNKNPKRLPGILTYLYGILAVLLRFRPAPVRVTIDGEVVFKKCLLVSVGNGHSHAGGLQMCPDAKPDDGVLDVLIAGDLGRMETLALLPKLPSGRHTTHPKVEIYRAKRVTIESPEPLVVQADGEILGLAPATIEILPGVLPVIGRSDGERGGEQGAPCRQA